MPDICSYSCCHDVANTIYQHGPALCCLTNKTLNKDMYGHMHD